MDAFLLLKSMNISTHNYMKMMYRLELKELTLLSMELLSLFSASLLTIIVHYFLTEIQTFLTLSSQVIGYIYIYIGKAYYHDLIFQCLIVVQMLHMKMKGVYVNQVTQEME